MKRILLLVAFAVPLIPLPAMPQSVFDGTWKIDLNKVDFPKNPDVLLLENGKYSCKTCAPAYEIKADGTDQPVTGHP